MIHQEYTALGLAAVCFVTNFLGAWFTIRRVYSKWVEETSSSTLGYIHEPRREEERVGAPARGLLAMIDDIGRKPSRTVTLSESPERVVGSGGLWKPLYPNSTYWTFNPLVGFDLIDVLQADGSVDRVMNWQRINEIYVPRFDIRTSLRSYNIVLFVPDLKGKLPERVPAQIKNVLNRFRAIVFAAQASGVTVDLSKVRLYILEAEDHPISFSVGEVGIEGRPVPFASWYAAKTKSFNAARGIFDDSVTTTFDRNEVDALRKVAEALGYGVPPLSIQEAEAKWGHFVPMPNWPKHEMRNVVGFDHTTFDDVVVDVGDGSFYIPEARSTWRPFNKLYNSLMPRKKVLPKTTRASNHD